MSTTLLIGHPEVHGRFAALYTTDGSTVRGAAIVNWPKALLACRLGMGQGVRPCRSCATNSNPSWTPSRTASVMMRRELVPQAETPRGRTIALACRVLAHRGLADGILGHISLG